jgi:hypothetical protein
MQPTPL